ncbi:MAG: T9SS type A sorting domain-containing protein, partial [Saprospiraceae bacterium]|nr:T9SS type A sorting domain-containing protein [Saprospiraceae bacterium]
NITDTAVAFVFDPVNDPVECHLQKMFPSPFNNDYVCLAYYMWADGKQNHWEGRPDFPVMANAAKNGMPSLFLVSVPIDLDTTTAYPLSVWLHGGGGRARQSLAGARERVNIDPARGILLAHNDRLHGYRGPSRPTSDLPSWHFGWSKNYDPFNSIMLSMDTVVNYTQRRYLWIDEWLARNFRIDTNRIHVHGHSMGAAGATALAKCYPGHYASATVFNTSCKGPQTSDGAAAYLGSFADNFPTNLKNNNNTPVRVFDIWDLYTNCSPERDLPIIRYWHGKQDVNNVNHWGPVAVENYVICDSTGSGLYGFWSEREHGINSAPDLNDHWIMGTAAILQTATDNVDFAELHYKSDISFPAFFNHRLDKKNNDPGTGLIGIDNGDGDNWGTWGGYHRWGNVVETPQLWAVAAWLESNAVFANDNSPEDFLTADLAIRRPQSFTPVTGEDIFWNVKDAATGDILQSGTTTVQTDDLVVIPQIAVFRESIRKVLISITNITTSVTGSSTDRLDLRVIPNPAFHSVETEPSWHTVSIIDLNGNVVQHSTVSQSGQPLDVSFLPAGLYVLNVMTHDGTRKTGRFVKL